jgi:hypothetical protein
LSLKLKLYNVLPWAREYGNSIVCNYKRDPDRLLRERV